jgi:anti-anti-sigma factor
MIRLLAPGAREKPVDRSLIHEVDRNGDMSIEIVERDGAVIVVVDGEVDMCAAAEFKASLARAGATTARAIVVDLDRVSFMDCAGAHVLLQFSVSDAGRNRLALTCGSPQVQRLLELSGVRRYLTFVVSSDA